MGKAIQDVRRHDWRKVRCSTVESLGKPSKNYLGKGKIQGGLTKDLFITTVCKGRVGKKETLILSNQKREGRPKPERISGRCKGGEERVP